MKKKLYFTILLISIILFPLISEVPTRTEETIYTMAAFSGNDYALTFARENAPAIYIHSDADNFLSLKKNFVYYWPLTEQWIIDDSILDFTFDGSIEIIDNKGKITTLNPVTYTFFNSRGTYENNWHVLTGESAQNEWNKYVKIVLDYQEAVSSYNKAVGRYNTQTTELFNQIIDLRTQGQPYESLLKELEELSEPVEPVPPSEYTVPPSKLQKGYMINIPEGEYIIRFVTDDGKIVQGSEKSLVSVAPRRTDSIGYEIFPEIQWTQPTYSSEPSSVLYLDGTSDIYLRPFYQNEYISLEYNKLIDNQDSGTPNLYSWKKIQQVPESRITVISDSKQEQVSLDQYIVEQSATTALGYTIVPYDPDGKHKGKNPSMEALYIPLDPVLKELRISITDLNDPLETASSVRIIKIINSIQHESIAVFIMVLPLLIGLIIFLVRKKKSSRI